AASHRDVPRNRVLGDDLIVEISRRSPKTPEQLSHIRNLPDRVRDRNAQEIVERVKRGLEVPADERPEPPVHRSEDPARARLVDLLDLLVQIRSRETGIARNVLANRTDLDRVIGLHWGEDQGAPPQILTGWRAKLVGNDLGRMLDGQIQLGVDAGARVPKVHRADDAEG
ncbi:MAG TPA: HRDC domain-containing protein, partial [bacterium]|nr:HRDC domain-containing protein [bacterium]